MVDYRFVADIDEKSGEPWCGDCARALPFARAAVKSIGGTLLEVQVGRKTDWKDKMHPFRYV